MDIENKTKEELIREIERLRDQISQLQKSGAECTLMEKQCQNLVQKGKDIMCTLDAAGYITFINPIAKEISGYTQDELIGKKFTDFILEQDKSRIIAAFGELLKTGDGTIELPFLDKKGEVWFFECYAGVVKEGNKVLGIRIIARDITKRKKIEDELQETRKQIEFVLGHTKTGLDIIDSKFNIRYIDPEWQKVYGDPKGKKCYEYFMDRKEVCSHCGITKAFATKEPVVTEEVLAKENNRPIQVTTIPFQDKNGEWLVAEVNVDMTEHEHMERILRESEEKFRSVVDNIAIGVALISPKMEILTLNKKMKEWFPNVDIDKKSVCYKAFNIPPREKVCSYCPTCKTLEDGKVHESITDTPRGDKTINYRVVSSPITDNNGKVIAAIEMVEDITERENVDKKLKTYQEHLEELVAERTQELETVNKIVKQDIIACNRMSDELQKSEKRYRELWDDAPIAYHTLNEKGILTNVNKTEAKMLGYKPKDMIGKSIFDFILPEQREEAQKRFNEKLTGRHLAKAEHRIYIRSDGSSLSVSIDDALERDNNGKIVGIKTTMVDVTESKKMEEALRESELQYKTTINSMRDAIYVVDADLRIILCNKSLQRWLTDMGLKTELSGEILFDVIPFFSDKVRNEYKQVFESGEILTTEEHINFTGKEWITEVRKIPIEENNKIVRVLTIIRDVTERKKTEETIRHLAYHDILTNLPNRTLFNNRLALELNRAQRNKQKVSVMLMDLDRFKNVNDTLGHSFGDQLLQSVGKRLSEIVRSSDTVARMGGDEFILLLPETPHIQDVTKIAKKILEAIRKPFLISGKEIKVTTSIGISIYPAHGEDAETLVKNADIAMYKAKKSGRNKYVRYILKPK